MEAFQPILLALLALNLAVFVPLVVRTVRERRGRTRDQQVDRGGDATDACPAGCHRRRPCSPSRRQRRSLAARYRAYR